MMLTESATRGRSDIAEEYNLLRSALEPVAVVLPVKKKDEDTDGEIRMHRFEFKCNNIFFVATHPTTASDVGPL